MKPTRILVLVLAITLLIPFAASAQKKQSRKATTEVKKDTLTILTEKATAGDAVAQNALGLWYYTGKNVKQDYETALKWWAKSADQGNEYAIGNMAMCYQLGKGIKRDSVMAISLYKKAVQKGNPDIVPQHEKLAENKENLFSNTLMYEFYTNGIGVKRNPVKAADYQEVLAESGDVDRQYRQALYYLNNDQADKAAPWFKAAAQQGKIGAVYYYGYLLHKGMGVSQNKEKGIELMKRAEEKGFLAADYQLGKIYYDGDGVVQDYKKAVEYLKISAPNNAKAQWLLGLCYLNGNGVNKNYHFATQWFVEAAMSHEKEFNALLKDDNNGPFSQYLSGLRNYYVDKNFDAALACFKKVEKAKVADGKTMQAICLANMENPNHNVKKAVKMLEKNIASSPLAIYYLSSMYETGNGVKRDVPKSLDLLQKAANAGLADAQCKLGDKYTAGDGMVQDYVKAAQLYLQAEAQHHLTSTSARNLANCYEKRISVLPDLNNAKKRIEDLKKVKDNDRLITILNAIEK